MPVTVHSRPVDRLSQAEIDRWNQIPVAIAVDVSNASCQIDPAIHPLCPPGRQPRLFGRAVTALCEPPDFGAVLHALDLIQPGDVLVIAANGHAETAMIGEILGGHLRRLGARGNGLRRGDPRCGTTCRVARFAFLHAGYYAARAIIDGTGRGQRSRDDWRAIGQPWRCDHWR